GRLRLVVEHRHLVYGRQSVAEEEGRHHQLAEVGQERRRTARSSAVVHVELLEPILGLVNGDLAASHSGSRKSGKGPQDLGAALVNASQVPLALEAGQKRL